jgi:hypothetical protein
MVSISPTAKISPVIDEVDTNFIWRFFMKLFKKAVLGAVLAVLAVGLAGAAATTTHSVQMQINEICLIGVTGAPAALVIAPPAAGGQTPANATDNSTYLLYTSTVAANKTRSISAAWGASDAAPAGCSLKLTATPGAGTNQGAPVAQITMKSTAQNIVTGIKSCATGTAAGSGARLTYVLSVDDVTALVASTSKTVTITFTLTDAA